MDLENVSLKENKDEIVRSNDPEPISSSPVRNDDEPELVRRPSGRNQVLGAIVCNFGMFSYGCAVGWSSPVLPVLQLTSSEYALTGALIPIGAIAALPIFGVTASRLGRKMGGYICGSALIIGLILISWRPNVSWMQVGRFLCGMGGGCATTLPTLYISETVELKYRGMLGSLMLSMYGLGILYSYVLGMLLEKTENLSLYIIPFPIVFVVTFWFLPETPLHQLKKGDELGALQSLSWLRRLRLESKNLLDEMKNMADQLGLKLSPVKSQQNEEINQRHSYFKRLHTALHILFTTKHGLKALHLMFALITAQTFTGIFAVVTYSTDIFTNVGSNLAPGLSSIICAICYVIGAAIGSALMDRAGRRILQISSCMIIFLCDIAMAISMQTVSSGVDRWFIRMIPVVTIPLSAFAYNMGIAIIPFVYMAEVFPQKAKDVGTTLCMLYIWTSVFVLLYFFPSTVTAIGLPFVGYIFAAFALFSAIHSYFFLVETKGKSSKEILESFSTTGFLKK